MNSVIINRAGCHVVVPPGLQCRADPVDPDADLPICWRHLRRILDQLRTRGAVVTFDYPTVFKEDTS